MDSEKTYYCSFCGKSQHEIDQLIAGPGGVFICDEFTELCMKIVLEHRTEKRPSLSLSIETRELERVERDVEREIDRAIERLQSLKRRAR